MLSRDNTEAAAQIASIFQTRRQHRSQTMQTMESIRDHYNGDVVVPLPELDANEKPATANLIYQGIEQFSLRVASTMPDVKFMPVKPNISLYDNRARNRRLAAIGWMDMNKMNHKLRRRARHLIAYGATVASLSPVSPSPSDLRKIPFWTIRNPLQSYPAHTHDPDDIHPVDCIFHSKQNYLWLKQNYPEAARAVYRPKDCQDHENFDILEYVDQYETAIIVLGKTKAVAAQSGMASNYATGQATSVQDGVTSSFCLHRVKSRLSMTPVVYACRTGLDRQAGMFDQLRGAYQRAALLDSLSTVAVFRNVFPDEWIESIPNQMNAKPRIATEADGKAGIRGVIENGRINVVHLQPGSSTDPAIDRLERNSRVTGALPQELGGESATNIRTASRGAAVLSSAIDMPMAEAQDIMASALEVELQIGVDIMKSYYGKEPKSFYMGSNGKVISDDYIPDVDFESDICTVSYSIPGADVNGMIVATGQMVGTEIMSKRTAMEMIPWVEDPMREQDQIEMEGLRRATLSGLEQQSSQGQLDPMVLARVAKIKAETHVPLEQALVTVHEEMQKEQAAQQAQQQAQQQQAQQGQTPQPDPSQMPGVAQAPPDPNNPPGTAVAPPSPSESNLSGLLAALRRPTRTSTQESDLGNPAVTGV